LSLNDLKAHCAVTFTTDDALLTRLLSAATKHTERQLGFTLASMEGGAPADLEQAVYLLAAHWYAEREASVAGVAITAVPFGYAEIIADHRSYTFGLPCEVGDDE